MARPLWKGSISFGLVNIPVELHVAVRDHRPRFRMLHAADRSPVNFTRVCAKEGRPVAWADLVKGYEYSKGQFVVLTKEDFRAAAVEKTRRVDIIDFVAASDIDDRFFETPYYVVPSRSGEHAYALLREAMRGEKRVGIAKFILRDAQHLAAVEVIGEALVLTVLRFADELVDTAQFSLPSGKALRKAELDMAKALVENLAAKWQPEKYTDEYRDNLMRIIQAKAKGKRVKLEAPEEPRQAEVIDLMERLRRSLAQRGSRDVKADPHARSRGATGVSRKAASVSRKATSATHKAKKRGADWKKPSAA
jgi:DNA end-binding protein Ku